MQKIYKSSHKNQPAAVAVKKSISAKNTSIILFEYCEVHNISEWGEWDEEKSQSKKHSRRGRKKKNLNWQQKKAQK